MKLYIDSDFKLHTTNSDGTFREVILSENATIFLANKCIDFIEGCRYVPLGESWTRSDGKVFRGEMISPWKADYELEAAQREYERQQLADCKAACERMGIVV